MIVTLVLLWSIFATCLVGLYWKQIDAWFFARQFTQRYLKKYHDDVLWKRAWRRERLARSLILHPDDFPPPEELSLVEATRVHLAAVFAPLLVGSKNPKVLASLRRAGITPDLFAYLRSRPPVEWGKPPHCEAAGCDSSAVQVVWWHEAGPLACEIHSHNPNCSPWCEGDHAPC